MTELEAVNGFCNVFKHEYGKQEGKGNFYFFKKEVGAYVKCENKDAATTVVQHQYEQWISNKANHWFSESKKLEEKIKNGQELTKKEENSSKVIEENCKAFKKLLTLESMNKCVKRILNHEAFTSDLDNEPNHVINMRGIVWDMKNGQEVEKGKYKTTKTTGVSPKRMGTPVWDKFLNDLFPNNEDRAWFERFLGYLITGENEKQFAYVMTGVGGDGKSVLNRVLITLLGDYATTVDEWVFDAERDKDKRETVFEVLQGIRYAGVSEIRKNMPLHESEFKKMTGSDPVTARALHQKAFMTTIQTKFCFFTNHMFSWSDNTNAIKRRLRVYAIPPNKKIKRDPMLFEKIERELGGIMYKCLVSANNYYKFRENGYLSEEDVTNTMINCLEEHTRFNDPLLDFFNECCKFEEGNRVKKSDFYKAYSSFARQSGENVMKKNEFYKEILSRAIVKTGKYNGYDMFINVSLLEEYTQKEIVNHTTFKRYA